MTEHEELRDWDAAYVLGALSTADRRRYERHLADCAACTSSTSDLAGLPGLLARVPVADAEAAREQAPPDVPNLLPKLTSHAVRRRRRRRQLVLAAVVATAIAGALVVVPGLVDSLTTPDTTAVQLQPVAQSSLEASIRLVEEEWGTRIEMECRYDSADGYSVPQDYALYVTDAAGDEARVATWTAAPGEIATLAASTSLTMAQIHTVDVRSVAGGGVLLRGSP